MRAPLPRLLVPRLLTQFAQLRSNEIGCMIGGLGQMRHSLGPLQLLNFQRMRRIGLDGWQIADMEDIGLHPKDLLQNLIQGDIGSALFDIQEGLAKDKLRRM